MKNGLVAAFCVYACTPAVHAAEAPAPLPTVQALPAAQSPVSDLASPPAKLIAGTPVLVTVDADIASAQVKIGDTFAVHVSQDVVLDGQIAIAKGTPGEGTVTFVTKNGGFGKAGILGIALSTLTLGERKVPLEGHFREEGRNKNGATAATFFAVGIFAAAIRGKGSVIPAGRELHGRLGEDVSLPAAPSLLTSPAETVPAESTPAQNAPATQAPPSRPDTAQPKAPTA